MKRRVLFLVVLLLMSPVFTAAQEPTPPPPAEPAPAPLPPTASPAVVQPVLPWFVMTGRVAFGGGSGSMDWHWDALAGLVDYDESVNFAVGGMSIIPEAFFMPTRGRHFLISASLPITMGGGTFAESDSESIDGEQRGEIIDGEKFTYLNYALALGLGYQWYFGAEQRTNLILMSHIGFGRFQFAMEWEGDRYNSDPLNSGMFDVSVGASHRFKNNFVLGGTLDFWFQRFSGQAGEEDFLDVDVAGGMGQVRLNALLGYAFF